MEEYFAADKILNEVKGMIVTPEQHPPRKVAVEMIQDAVSRIESAREQIEELHEEMESWASNMEGTNLEYTEKYSIIFDTAAVLNNAIDYLDVEVKSDEDLLTMPDDVLADYLDEMIDTIESADGECQAAEFPGMFG
jgi:quinolinate synthase